MFSLLVTLDYIIYMKNILIYPRFKLLGIVTVCERVRRENTHDFQLLHT